MTPHRGNLPACSQRQRVFAKDYITSRIFNIDKMRDAYIQLINFLSNEYLFLCMMERNG